jgi:trehalose-6-phosphate synthase
MLVNPWDSLGVANAINSALRKTTEERELKHNVNFTLTLATVPICF